MDRKTVNDWLNYAINTLSSAGIPSARLDALILLEDASGINRANILAHPEKSLRSLLSGLAYFKNGNKIPRRISVKELDYMLSRRVSGEPLAYIRGFVEFYNNKFVVNRDVLVPRTESEDFLYLLNTLKPKKGQTLIDVGTGSGILAICAKLDNPQLKIKATDISYKALKVAKINAKTLKAKIYFQQAYLLSKQKTPVDFILANLPYIPNGYSCFGVEYEPKSAIFAKNDGLEFINAISLTAYKLLNTNGYILIESLKQQHNAIYDIYSTCGFELIGNKGLIQVFIKPK